jgi:hypothetical protein
MPEKIVTCGECEGMFDVGHIPPGRDVKCPQCGNAMVVPGAEGAAPGSGVRPKTSAGSSPRMATASGTSPGTRGPGLKRSTPLMRRVNKSRMVRGETLSGSRHPAVPKKNSNLPVIFSLVGVVVVVVILMVVLNKDKPAKTPRTQKAGTEEPVSKTGGSKPAAPAPAAGGSATRPVSAGGATTPKAPPKPPLILPTFKTGSDGGAVDGWEVDADLLAEVEKQLEASYAADPKNGDPAIRNKFVLESAKYFRVIADRLRSDKESVAKEAAAVANRMLKKHDISIGKPGSDFIPNIDLCNDPEKRTIFFREMREAWSKAEDRITSDPTGGAAGSDAPMAASGTVGALKRGGIEREEIMVKLKANPGRNVRMLIPYLKTEDPLEGRAVAKALNELTGANIEVPRPAQYNGEEMKKQWDEWLVNNLDKLK